MLVGCKPSHFRSHPQKLPMDGSPPKKFKLDLAGLGETFQEDERIPTQKLFKAYQKGELSMSILSKDDPKPSTSSAGDAQESKPTGAKPVQPAYQEPVKNAGNTVVKGVEATSTSSAQSAVEASKRKGASGNSLLVNSRQRGNPILKFIRNVAWEFVEMEPDYVMGRNVCALYLSLRYHNFNPNYIHERIQKIGQNFELRALLVQVDITEPYNALKELTRVAILANMTLLLAWSAEEAGRYLETFKAFENKPVDLIKEKVNTDYYSQAIDFLTTVRSVNKTDTATLLTQFGSIEGIMKADPDELSLCPGLGSQKANRLHEIFRTPFPRR